MISSSSLKYSSPESYPINPGHDFDSGSVLMQDIFRKILSIAWLEKHIVLIGEIGVGKKRLAQIIHKHSKRAKGPFHSFYCIDVNDNEFKEAFWEHIYFQDEHVHLKYSLLEKASNGTIYLDQFSELTDEYILNVVESYVRGCNQTFRYNPTSSPRLILSITQESYRRLNNTKVWERLLRDLNPISIAIPPLRERKEDIPELINIFLAEGRIADPEWKQLSISAEAVAECLGYEWPGNIRQLKNAIMQGAVLSRGETIKCCHLPFSMSWKLPYKPDEHRTTTKRNSR